MGRALHIRPLAGMAGDMFVAGLTALGAPETELIRVLDSAAGRLGTCTVDVEDAGDHEDAPSRRLRIRLQPDLPTLDAVPARRHLADILAELDLELPYAAFAARALEALIQAEAQAHNAPDPDHVHLHEAQDILIDVAGAAFGLQALEVDPGAVTCAGPVPTGSGTIQTSHGPLDVPAPATRNILASHHIPWSHGQYDTEVLTPTGAALLAALNPRWIRASEPDPGGRTGWGRGTKDLGLPNVLGLVLT